MTDTANIITTGTGKEGLWPGSTFYPAQTIAPDALIFSQTSVGGTISGDGPVARIPSRTGWTRPSSPKAPGSRKPTPT